MSFKIISLPGRGDGNPYVDLFYDALAPYGINLVCKLKFDQKWFSENLNTFDAIHLHWPENIWRNYKNPKIKKLSESDCYGTWRLSLLIEKFFSNKYKKESLLWFGSLLEFLKKKNKKIIWTWHNVEPHENVDAIDRQGQQILASHADLIIFHSELSEEKCRENYKIYCRTVVMQHGNYDGIYPESRDKNKVTKELGLNPHIPLVGCLGGIREYKGIDIAIEACAHLAGDVQFLCAGKPHPDFNFEGLRRHITKVKRHKLIDRFITDQEFSDYANACDVLLLPYKYVTGSGALLAALTLEKGVVASDLPYFRDIVSQVPDAGRLVPVGDDHALSKAIVEYLNVPENVRERAAKNLAARYSWDKVICPVARELCNLGKLSAR